jgi:DNA gyrase/topoisomerase IV subunit A
MRVRILTTLQEASTQRDAVVAVVAAAPDRRAAIAALQHRFGWDDVQARAVVEMRMQDWTAQARARTAADLAEAQQALDAEP